MAYKLWLKQDGYGCDYMIGCGNELFNLNAKDKSGAIIEATTIIDESTHEERTFKTALLLEVIEDISNVGQEIVSKQAAARYERIQNDKREQLKKLKKELGEE